MWSTKTWGVFGTLSLWWNFPRNFKFFKNLKFRGFGPAFGQKKGKSFKFFPIFWTDPSNLFSVIFPVLKTRKMTIFGPSWTHERPSRGPQRGPGSGPVDLWPLRIWFLSFLGIWAVLDQKWALLGPFLVIVRSRVSRWDTRSVIRRGANGLYADAKVRIRLSGHTGFFAKNEIVFYRSGRVIGPF